MADKVSSATIRVQSNFGCIYKHILCEIIDQFPFPAIQYVVLPCIELKLDYDCELCQLHFHLLYKSQR